MSSSHKDMTDKIILRCSCSQKLSVPGSFVGQQVRCPACKSIVTVLPTSMQDTLQMRGFGAQSLHSTQTLDEVIPSSPEPKPRRSQRQIPEKSWTRNPKGGRGRNLGLAMAIGGAVGFFLLVVCVGSYYLSLEHRSGASYNSRFDVDAKGVGQFYQRKDSAVEPIWFVMRDFAQSKEANAIMNFRVNWQLSASSPMTRNEFVWIVESQENDRRDTRIVEQPMQTSVRSGEISVDVRNDLAGKNLCCYVGMKKAGRIIPVSGKMNAGSGKSTTNPPRPKLVDKAFGEVAHISGCSIESNACECRVLIDYQVYNNLELLDYKALDATLILETERGTSYAMRMDLSAIALSGVLSGTLPAGADLSGPYTLRLETYHPVAGVETISNEFYTAGS